MNLHKFVRTVPNFPKDGILFRDITPLLADIEAFNFAIDEMVVLSEQFRPDVIAGIESRGFLFGAPISLRLGLPFVPIRKEGKLPFEKKTVRYDLEYGNDILEIHVDAFKAGQKVLLVDDLIATGGTFEASSRLVGSLNAEVVGICVLIELSGFGRNEFLSGRKILSVLQF
ncbi:MAG: adenine phosphoribosyltransferase [SAR202 cluster bacterium Io17-Chloro-G3]|nr:MAG: adenine phosphoribosyltransferase [SAR202 cluster bacterium Io17-Chloro-G3]